MATLGELLNARYDDDDVNERWQSDPFGLAEDWGISLDQSQVDVINGGNAERINELISEDGAEYFSRGGLDEPEEAPAA